MQKTLKTLIKAFVCVIFAVVSPVLNATDSNPSKQNIIYEYKIITQKKGQSLDAALKTVKLSPYQTQLILSIPVMRAAKSDRTFRLAYELRNKQRLLREVRVTRGNRMANFVLTGTDGQHRFVSQASHIPEKVVRIPVSPQKSEASSKRQTASNHLNATNLFALTFPQKKEQPLNEALQPVQLSQYQQQIIQKGAFIKSARSIRQFTLFFEQAGARRLLKGLRIVRGNIRVNYLVKKIDNTHQLVDLDKLPTADKKKILKQFDAVNRVTTVKKVAKTTTPTQTQTTQAAKKVEVKTTPEKKVPQKKAKTPTNTSPSPTATAKTKTKRTISRTQGNYQLLRLQQKTGQSIAAMIKNASLSAVQKELITKIPVMKQAKSTRQFNLLFEKKGKQKLLRAVSVNRGSKHADFVLVNHKGKWLWANKKGEINTAGGSSGFLRYPLKFSRISSHFSLRRRHPITGRIRPHTGTDFKAPHGRNIWAPADGVVTFAGRQRGYGITLIIDHQNGYKTKYAHLSRILRGVRKGQRVKKKQIIARVGNTGLSTGSHLHYEVIVNGRPRNPLTVSLPGGGGKKVLSEGRKNATKYLPKLQQIMK